MGYAVSTPVFEGPFDLLLHLILREQVDLYDISLSTIVDADRILVLNRGELIAEGLPAEVRRDPQVRAIYLGEGLVYDARHQEGAGA